MQRQSNTPAEQAERRQLTVMFCDLVGSSALATRLDPEELRHILGAFQAACTAEIHRTGGIVAQYLGDGVLAYFGHPTANEDDAERAVRAGLAVVAGMAAACVTPNLELQARVGIASGTVVVGQLSLRGGTQQNAAVGAATNRAARLQELAEPNTVLIDNQTFRLAGGMFDYRELGPRNLKGFPDPEVVRQVTGPSQIDNRFDARPRSLDPKMQGRRDEFSRLLASWDMARCGDEQIVLVTGDAGIGKTRLVRAFLNRVARENCAIVSFHCSPFHRESALYPVVSSLARAAGILPSDGSATRVSKLAKLLSLRPDGGPVDYGLLLPLLGHGGRPRTSASASASASASGLTPSQLRERTLSALRGSLDQLCAKLPVVVVVEDIHWADPTSLELMSRIISQPQERRLMIIITSRSEPLRLMADQPRCLRLPLSRLSDDDARSMVVARGGALAFPVEVVEFVVSRTDGVPLFVEELTETIVESGLLRELADRYELIRPLPSALLPSTLQSSLLARLDRIPSAKVIAQQLSVLGREFTHAAACAVVEVSETELVQTIEQLVTSGLLDRDGAQPNSSYRFKHALVQSVTYESLLGEQRRSAHARIAAHMASAPDGTGEFEPEVTAYHFAQAGLTFDAAKYFMIAAQAQLRRSAMEEAASNFNHALEMLRALPQSTERSKMELDLQIGLSIAVTSGRGFAAEAAGAAFERAREISHDLRDMPSLLRVSYGKFFHHLMRGEVDDSEEIAGELARLAEKTGSSDALILGHRTLGVSMFQRGRLQEARRQLEQAQLLSGARADPVSRSQTEASIMIQAWLGHILALQGCPAQALAKCKQYSGEGRHRVGAYIECFAVGFAASLALLLRDMAELERRVRILEGLLHEHRFLEHEIASRIFRGCVEARRGDANGLSLMRSGIRTYRDIGARWSMPYWQAALAEAVMGIDLHEASAVLDSAFEDLNAMNERWAEPELYRLRGNLALRRGGGNLVDAEAEYRAAISIAQSQGSRLYELRSASSLAQLWFDNGRHAEARELLVPLYVSFDEGLDAPDLISVQTILRKQGELV